MTRFLGLLTIGWSDEAESEYIAVKQSDSTIDVEVSRLSVMHDSYSNLESA